MKKYITFNDTLITLNGEIISKRFILKKINYSESEKVSHLIYDYYQELKSTGIPLPKLFSYNNLDFSFEYCGDSLIEILKKDNLSDSFLEDVIEQISLILKKCAINKVSMDPHIKNFTILNGEVYYVDTFPPVSKEYIKLLSKYNSKNKKHIIDHLNTWGPNQLRYHFLADIFKTKNLNPKLFKKSKDYFIKFRHIRNFDENRMNNIIKTEDTNILRKGFTLS